MSARCSFDVGSRCAGYGCGGRLQWLLCPNGATFFYVSPELRRMLRPSAIMGWRSDKGWRSVDQLQHGTPDLTEAAERYEGGMLISVAVRDGGIDPDLA